VVGVPDDPRAGDVAEPRALVGQSETAPVQLAQRRPESFARDVEHVNRVGKRNDAGQIERGQFAHCDPVAAQAAVVIHADVGVAAPPHRVGDQVPDPRLARAVPVGEVDRCVESADDLRTDQQRAGDTPGSCGFHVAATDHVDVGLPRNPAVLAEMSEGEAAAETEGQWRW
jgi:hypothetical protein